MKGNRLSRKKCLVCTFLCLKKFLAERETRAGAADRKQRRAVEDTAKTKLNSVASVRKQTIPTDDRRLSAKLVPTFADRGCRVVSAADPYGRNFGFLDRSRPRFSLKQLLNCTYEAEWTPFQTHYVSENLVPPGIEPGILDL
jgi:hypothetical protein